MSGLSNANNIGGSNAPIAWFQNPNLPGTGPKPELAAYIYQGETEQKGSGPVGITWTPTNPATEQPASTTTERSKLDSLFPSQKPLQPVFNIKKDSE